MKKTAPPPPPTETSNGLPSPRATRKAPAKPRVVRRRKRRAAPRSRALKPLVAAATRNLPRKMTREETSRVSMFAEYAIRATRLFAEKHLDYGDTSAEDGTLGNAIFLRKKLNRLLNVAGRPTANETKVDSARDAMVFGGMLWAMLEGAWPGMTTNPRLAL